jgi:hypothetical protein
MPASKHVSAAIEPHTPINQGLPEEMEYRLPEAYHKILDYHVAEILLSTIVLAAIAFLRLHLHH